VVVSCVVATPLMVLGMESLGVGILAIAPALAMMKFVSGKLEKVSHKASSDDGEKKSGDTNKAAKKKVSKKTKAKKK